MKSTNQNAVFSVKNTTDAHQNIAVVMFPQQTWSESYAFITEYSGYVSSISG